MCREDERNNCFSFVSFCGLDWGCSPKWSRNRRKWTASATTRTKRRRRTTMKKRRTSWKKNADDWEAEGGPSTMSVSHHRRVPGRVQRGRGTVWPRTSTRRKSVRTGDHVSTKRLGHDLRVTAIRSLHLPVPSRSALRCR